MGDEPTTPPPLYYTGPQKPEARPSPMAPTDRTTYRQAAYLVRKLYPGAVGELLSSDLLAQDEFGWMISENSLLARARTQILREWGEHEKRVAAQRAGAAP